MIGLASECFESGDVWRAGRRGVTHSGDQKPGAHRLAPVCLHSPALRRFIVMAGDYARAEVDVLFEVQPVGDEIQIIENLWLGRIAAAPFPLFAHLVGERVAIVMALRVAARSGVAVPIPGSANAIGGFDQSRCEPEFAKAVQHIQPGKSCSDDNRIDFGRTQLRLTHRFSPHPNPSGVISYI